MAFVSISLASGLFVAGSSEVPAKTGVCENGLLGFEMSLDPLRDEQGSAFGERSTLLKRSWFHLVWCSW